MAKVYVISEKVKLNGVFTQKKKLWEIMKFDDKQLMVAKTKDKFVDLNYAKLCKYIKERGILQIYTKEEVENTPVDGWIDHQYLIWELEQNTFFEYESRTIKAYREKFHI